MSPAIASGPLRSGIPGGVLVMVGLSLVAHGAALALMLRESEPDPRLAIPAQHVITTRLVKFGKKPRPKEWLPRLPVVAAPRAPKGVAVKPLAPPSKAPTGPSLSDRVKRMGRMQKALHRIAKPGEDPEEYGSPFGVTEGTVSSFTEAVMGNTYITRVKQAIMAQYDVPKIITRDVCRRLKAVALIKIAADGTIVDMTIEATSGNERFDTAVLRAIQRVGKLPPPPREVAARMLADGVELHAPCQR